MRKIVFILLILISGLLGKSQKLSFRCNFNAVQVQSWEVKQRINSDTNIYDGYRFYIDSFITSSKVVTEIPGLSLEFRFPSNWFIESGLNYSTFVYRDSYFPPDTIKTNVAFRVHRANAVWEGGYYFRKAKIFKPYFAMGVSLTKIYARIKDDYDQKFNAYQNYFKHSPFFLSMNFRTGIKFGAISIGFAYSTSITKTSTDKKMGKYNHFTLFSFSSDIIRTTSLKKTQYKSRFESDELIIKKSQSLKQTENSWVFGMTYYQFINSPYIVAYSEGTTDYRIEPMGPPRVAWIPNVSVKTLNAKNSKRTLYAHSNGGFAIIAMKYENAYTQTTNPQTFTTPENDPTISNSWDVKMPYLDANFGGGHGFKIKTTPRSFIYGEYEAKIHTIFKTEKMDEYKIPPMKLFFCTLGFEGGFRFRHSGLSLNFSRSIGKLDKYEFYDKMFSLSLKFTYDISTK